MSRLLEKMNLLEKPFKNSNILILGVAYKKDIGDVRESPALGIIENLSDRGVNVKFYDPYVAEVSINGECVEKEENLENIDKYDLILVHTAIKQTYQFLMLLVVVTTKILKGSSYFWRLFNSFKNNQHIGK